MKFTLLLFATFISVSQFAFAQNTVFFNEDFNAEKWESSIGDSNFCVPEMLPEDWAVFDSLGLDYFWHWSLEGPRGHFTNPQAPLEPNNHFLNDQFWPAQATLDNGFIMLESDFHNTDSLGRLKAISHPLSSYIQVGPIDLSDSEFPLIEFSTVLIKCCDPIKGRNQLLVSTNYSSDNPDNAIWQEYNIEIGQDELYANRVQFDISSQTGGKSNVYLRFKQMKLSHHFWMIDDITIFEAQKSDVTLNDSWFDYHTLMDDEDYLDFNSSFIFNGGYTKIPSFTSSNFIQLRAAVTNNGSNSQSINLNATFYKEDSKISETESPSITLGFLESDTITLPVSFNTSGIGNYQISTTLITSDDNEDYSNNSIYYDFEITENTYSHVYEENARSFVGRGPSYYYQGGKNGDIITQRYEILPKVSFATINSIKFYLPSYDQPSEINELEAIKNGKFSVIARFYKEDKDNKHFPVLPAIIFSDEYTLSIQDTGSWITIPFVDEGNLNIESGVYFAGIEMYKAVAEPRALNFKIGADQFAPKQMFAGGQIYLVSNGEWHNSYANYAIDLNTKSLNNISFFKNSNHTAFPNPCQSSIQLENSENISAISIYSLDGKLIYTTNNIGKIIDVSSFEKGIYLLTIVDKNQKTHSQKLIKQ